MPHANVSIDAMKHVVAIAARHHQTIKAMTNAALTNFQGYGHRFAFGLFDRAHAHSLADGRTVSSQI